MTVWAEPTECSICGFKGHGIRPRLVEWLDALPGMRWSHVDRCDDRAACRARVEEAGRSWPLVESDR